MKQKTSLTRIARCLTLFGLIFFACIVSARAQVRAFVDCVERVDADNYRVHFGYVSLNAAATTISSDSPFNFFTPIPDPPGQPTVFFSGVHHRVVSAIYSNEISETWVLGFEGYFATAKRPESFLPCNDAGSNTRTITYQGRLSDANAAANGQYDLRFQLFNAASDGLSQSATLALENVQVTNGIFTVQLDFGILPAILNGNNLFLEIGVRAGTSIGAYTTLTPRQPLTATPYAIRAQSAANADLLNGVNADGFVRSTSKNNKTNQVIESSLTVKGKITGTITNAINATNVSGGYVQLPLTTNAPPATECDEAAEYGRQKVDATDGRLYICIASGWKSTVLQ